MESSPSASTRPAQASEIVLGLAGTVDLELEWSAARWSQLAQTWGVRICDADPDLEVVDERSLLQVCLGLMVRGVGSERYLASSAIAYDFAARFEHRVTLGGTNIRAAIALAVLGIPATVAVVDVDPTMERLLPAGVEVLSVGTSERLDPHMIVQYPAGAVLELLDGSIRTPHPNRIILTNDPPNRLLHLASGLPDAAVRARLVVLSSLNAIQEPAVLSERLAQLTELVSALPEDTLVMWEDAGYHRPELRGEVTAVMVGLAHIYSLNEDELAEIIQRPVELHDAADVAVALTRLRDLVPAPTLVVHTKHWALALGERAAQLRPALRGGITMASARYLFGDGLTRAQYDEVSRLRPQEATKRLAWDLERLLPDLVVEPALVLRTDSPTTIGLGDTFVGGFVAALAGGPRGAP